MFPLPFLLASSVNAPTVILALIILALFVAVIARGIIRRKKGGGCGCGCSGCSGACHCHTAKTDHK